MREWSLGAGAPLSLLLSADTRFCTPDPFNDHTWEVDLAGGEPPGLSIRTSYGLRARGMRLFYRFSEAGRVIADPAAFHRPPVVLRFHPNFISLALIPLEGLDAIAEYWVPESQVVAGRITLTNRTTFPRHLDLELCALLSPLEGKPLGLARHEMVRVLSGASGGLHPVLFMSAGPRQGPGPHPSLGVGLDFEAGATRAVSWACAALAEDVDSFELARRTAGRNWDAERARIQLSDAHHTLEIHTGDPDWDAAFALSQTAALRSFLPGASPSAQASFSHTRSPDGGFSRTGNGSHHPGAWGGHSAFDAYYLASLLPGAPELRRSLFENFLSIQADDGSIDAGPGPAGQRSRFLAAPLLASLAWELYEESEDERLLAESFPRLFAFFECWFGSRVDPDGDGVPAWEHVLQTGFEENPLFDVWYPWSQSLGIQTLFNPELESMLFREASALMRMAQKLGLEDQLVHLRQRAPVLSASIAASWHPRLARYGYRDRLTGSSWTHRLIGSCRGPGEIRPRRPQCEQPVRLLVQVHTKSAAATRPTVEVFGKARSPGGGNGTGNASPEPGEGVVRPASPERIEPQRFQWRTGGLVATTESVYDSVERVLVHGLAEKDRLVIRTVDTAGEDITLFTPLWARVPHPDRARALVHRLTRDSDGFDRPFGIPALPASPSTARAGTREHEEADYMAMSVMLPWNNLIGEGLLEYGFRDEAATLVVRLMNAVVGSLKKSAAFYERYHAVTGNGLGERGALPGLAPVGLFLRTLGVRILSATRVQLDGRNPFPWPVTIVYRGLRVVRGLETTEVSFGGKEPITITDDAACVVTA